MLQDIWLAAIGKISFRSIFLQANEPGKTLYEEFGFVELEGYVAPTVDDKVDVDDCIPMLCDISEDFMYMAFE